MDPEYEKLIGLAVAGQAMAAHAMALLAISNPAITDEMIQRHLEEMPSAVRMLHLPPLANAAAIEAVTEWSRRIMSTVEEVRRRARAGSV